MKANERDVMLPDPEILRPPERRAVESMDDVTDFPH